MIFDMVVHMLNKAYSLVFPEGRLTLGLMTPLTPPAGVLADPATEKALAQHAEACGFSALWTRDVPLMIPQAGEVSALDDPFLWLGMLAAATNTIAVGTAAAVLPLRHPLLLAKSALTLDRLSGGRFLLGVGSGDREEEFAAFGMTAEQGGERFRAHWEVVRAALDDAPDDAAKQVLMNATGGHAVLPRAAQRIAMLAVGSARQSLQWIAANADGWASYHREEQRQQGRIGLWQQALAQRAGGAAKPFIQSLNLDLLDDPDAPSEPITLGMRSGRYALLDYLQRLHGYGVGHVLLNLARQGRPRREVMDEIGREVIPQLG
ncbi:TIGR03571 family LLM class oxidoreductase [Herbaspirillum sp. meg3]|uniref:TIGR03571 family LLM class oxidoreductase n=1 Tax=Herbaspirillum sp. meg3 TaxID=2025949 RepID=UPI0018DF42DA|nr:TIGR03571 family LLM class oxidoreductase [Herbaspirillum sp. meg3]